MFLVFCDMGLQTNDSANEHRHLRHFHCHYIVVVIVFNIQLLGKVWRSMPSSLQVRGSRRPACPEFGDVRCSVHALGEVAGAVAAAVAVAVAVRAH